MVHSFFVIHFNVKFTEIKDTLCFKVQYQFSKCIFAVIFGLAIFMVSTIDVFAQSRSDEEAQIRRLEAEQVEYLIHGNVTEMKKNWAFNFTVNNPFNIIQDASTGPIQSGILTYLKFERNIEKVLVHDSIIIVMGNELVIPKTAPTGSSHDTNQPIKRRFTNVWMQKEGKWLMIARHASNICSN